MSGEHLKLDRDQTNAGFQSWRLSQSAGEVQQHAVALPGTVHTLRQEGYDYLHTRIAVMRNHLIRQGQLLYTFLDDKGAHRLDAQSMEGRDLCQLSGVASPAVCSTLRRAMQGSRWCCAVYREPSSAARARPRVLSGRGAGSRGACR